MTTALLIGTGSIGQRHLRNLVALRPDTRFIFLRTDARRDELSEQYSAHVVGAMADALALGPDYAVVANPSALHAQSLLPLIRASVPCYIEKPVATERGGMKQLADVLADTGYRAPTLMGCNLRFLPSLLRLREAVVANVAGKIVRASLQAGQWLPDWRTGRDYRQGYSASAKRGGGVILDLVHELDMARWLFGEFESVQAMAGRFSGLQIDSEDTAVILLGQASERRSVSVALDYVSRRPVRRYELVGEQGTLVWDLGAKSLELITRDGRERLDQGEQDFDVAATYSAAASQFLDAVERGTPTTQDIHEGMRSAELALRAREAAGL